MVQAQPNPQLDRLPQRRWTVDEYHRMIAAGILTANDRVELLDAIAIRLSRYLVWGMRSRPLRFQRSWLSCQIF
jgi:hypothetical protein